MGMSTSQTPFEPEYPTTATNEALSTIARTAAQISPRFKAVAHALNFTAGVLYNRNYPGDHQVVERIASEVAELQAALILGQASTPEGNDIEHPTVTPASKEGPALKVLRQDNPEDERLSPRDINARNHINESNQGAC